MLRFKVIKKGISASITSITNRRHRKINIETNLKNTGGTIICRCNKSKSL